MVSNGGRKLSRFSSACTACSRTSSQRSELASSRERAAAAVRPSRLPPTPEWLLKSITTTSTAVWACARAGWIVRAPSKYGTSSRTARHCAMTRAVLLLRRRFTLFVLLVSQRAVTDDPCPCAATALSGVGNRSFLAYSLLLLPDSI